MSHTTIPAVLMSALSLVCIIFLLLILRRSLRRSGWTQKEQNSFFSRAVLYIMLWVVLITVLSLAGFFRNFSLPPRIAVMIFVALVLCLVLSASKKITVLLSFTPVHWLVLMQSFRILVEVLLFLSFRRGLLPVQMTWAGNNYDLLSGILALPVGWWMSKNQRRSRGVGIFFNVVGLLLLLNVLVVAVLSMPTPIRYFKNEPSVAIVADFPFIFLPGILVVLALALHILSLRQLSRPIIERRK